LIFATDSVDAFKASNQPFPIPPFQGDSNMAKPKGTNDGTTEVSGDGEGKGKGKRAANIPVINSAADLTTLVGNHRAATAGDGSRQFTQDGFKAYGGVINLPPSTISFMIGELCIALCSQAQGTGAGVDAANAQLKIVGPYVANAQQEANELRLIQAAEDLADGIDYKPRSANESAADYIKRLHAAGIKALG